MKRIGLLLAAFNILIGAWAGCGGSTPVATDTAKPTAVGKAQRAEPTPTNVPEKPRPRTVEELAALSPGPQRQQILEQGAREEGEVMVYNITTGLEPVAEDFMKKYPFIKAEIFTTRAPALVERVTAETKARRLGGDVLHSPLAVYSPVQDTVLKFNSPNAQFTSAPKAATNSALLVVFAYSTKRVPPSEAPAKVEDLLQPKWKGKLGFFAPPNIYPGLWVNMLLETMGEANAKRFLASLSGQDLFFYDSPQIAEKASADGQIDINMQGSTSARRRVAEGLPINWAAPEPTMGQVNLITLFKESKHPHAALLFIDYMFSDEAQSKIKSLGYFTTKEVSAGEIDGVKLPKTIWLPAQEHVDKIPEGTKIFEQLVMKK